MRPQTTRVRARGFGVARIYDAAGTVPCRPARTAHSRPPVICWQRRLPVAPRRCTPPERRPAFAVCWSKTAVDSTHVSADLVGCLVGKVQPRGDAEPDDLYPTARGERPVLPVNT